MLTPLYDGHFENNGYYLGDDARTLFTELLTGKTRKEQLRYLREATIDGLLSDLTAQGRKVRVCEHCQFPMEYKRSTKRFCKSCMQREQDNKRSNTRKEERAAVSPKRYKSPAKQVDEGRDDIAVKRIEAYWLEFELTPLHMDENL